MTGQDRSQADLLALYIQNRTAPPPEGLDADLVSLTSHLAAELTPPAPSPRFVRNLEQQLGTTPAETHHGATLPGSRESDLAITATSSGSAIHEPPRSRIAELARLGAAMLAIILIGLVLIFMFSDDEGDSRRAGAPEPTAIGSMAMPFSNDILISWDPDGGEQFKLYIVDALGENAPRRVTTDQPDDGQVIEQYGTWSPDGQHIAYIRTARSPELAVTNPDGTTIVNISEITGLDRVLAFAWSPDNERIAFSTDAGDEQGLYVVNRDGSNLQTITSDHLVMDVAWAPSGSLLAFTAFETRYPSLYTVAVDGSNLRQHETSLGPSDLRWSPSGEYLSYAAGRAPLYVYRLDPESGDERQLTAEPVGSYGARWERDGRQIAFIVHDAGGSLDGTMISDADGSNQRLVTPLSGRYDWSPDGSRFVIIMRRSELAEPGNMVIMLNDGRVLDTPLVDAAIDGWPAWRPPLLVESEHIPGPTPDAAPTPVAEPTTTPEPLSEPPRVSLTYREQTLFAGAHSYCWPTSPDGEILCAESDRDVPPLPEIRVPIGAELGFEVEGGHAISSGGVAAVRLVSTPYPDGSGSYLTFDFPGTTLPFEQRPDGTVIIADVPDGDYSFEVGITMDLYPDHQGEASYAFRVFVGDPDAPPPEEPDRFDPILTYEDQTQAGIFSYGCNWEGDPVCVDPGGLRFPTHAINVPEGATMHLTFDNPAEIEIVSFDGRIHLTDGVEIGQFGTHSEIVYPTPHEATPIMWGSLEDLNVVADLPPGNYALTVTYHAAQGSGTYGFNVNVMPIEEPWRVPDTTGTIVEAVPRGDDLRILIIEHPENPNAGDQMYITVRPKSRVFEHTAEGVIRRTVADLGVDKRVTVAITGEIATSYPGYANGSEIVIIRTETDGPPDPDDLVTMTFLHSQMTGFAPIPAGDALYVAYETTGGERDEVYFCADDGRADRPCTSSYEFTVDVDVPRGAELQFTIYRISRDNPDEPEVVKQGREVLDADMITRSWYRYGASNPGGY